METNAVVLAVRRGKAVILKNGGIYEVIPNHGYFVGERIMAVQPLGKLRRRLMIAACFVLLLTSSLFVGAKYLPWTYISIASGETSIQYCLNARNEVLSAEAASEEGQAILDQVGVSAYEPIERTMERTLAAMRSENVKETSVQVEIASRFGDGQRVEDAVAEAGKAVEMEMTLKKAPWQEINKPKDQPPEMKQENPPASPEDQPSPIMPEAHEEAPAEGAQPSRERMGQTPLDPQAGFEGQKTNGERPSEEPMIHPETPADPQEAPAITDHTPEQPKPDLSEAAPFTNRNEPMDEGAVKSDPDKEPAPKDDRLLMQAPPAEPQSGPAQPAFPTEETTEISIPGPMLTDRNENGMNPAPSEQRVFDAPLQPQHPSF